MCTPNLPRNDMQIVIPEWYEPFPEPQTIPSGWDLSAVLSGTALAAIDQTAVSAEE
jgi:hypothetical protein